VANKKRIVRYRKRYHINLGVIIIASIFIYLGINCFIYLTRDKVSIYEVTKGECEKTESIKTTGLVLRQESVITAPSSGYINYYVKDSGRVSVGDIIYTIDESGTLSELLKQAVEENSTLTDANLQNIREDITNFVTVYDNIDFEEVYEFKYTLDGSLLDTINVNSLNAISESVSADGGNAISINSADRTGYVLLYTDGYEGLTEDTFTSDNMNESSYKKDVVSAGSTVEAGRAVLKYITSEDWKIIIPLTDSQYNSYKDETAVDLYFPGEDIKTSAYFKIIDRDSKHYGVIDLYRYMTRFSGRRFIDVEIMGDTVEGLKVPKSSVTDEEFYRIPIGYMVSGGNSDDNGFNKEYVDNGETAVKFVATDIVSTDDEYCYINLSDENITQDTILVKPDSDEKFSVGEKGTLTGVYNVNTGYTIFSQIHILSEKNDYYIVESDTRYGLQMYDQIVLNADLVDINQVIFK